MSSAATTGRTPGCCPLQRGAASTGGRNILAEHLGWFHPIQSLSRAVVQLPSYRIELGSSVNAQIGILGEVLAEQAVAVLTAAALPRAVRIAEEDTDVGIDSEPHVIGHFFAPVPGERAAQLRGQRGELAG